MILLQSDLKPHLQAKPSVAGDLTIRIHECEYGIENSVPRITDVHHKACKGMTKSDLEEQIFYHILMQIMDFFS